METEGAGLTLMTTSEGREHILFDSARIAEPEPGLFDSSSWEGQDRVVTIHYGRGPTYVVDAGSEVWVLRHMRRGGLPARVMEDRYVWLGAARSRPFRELRILDRLAREGFPVPEPVAARIRRSGLFYEGDILTTRVPGEPLAQALRDDRPMPSAWRLVGRTLRRFHERGLFHADLSAGNVLVGVEGVFLIDFDRARFRRQGSWTRGNLARLERSARKLAGAKRWEGPDWEACWRAFLAGYDSGTG